MNMNEELRKVSSLRAERDRLLERVARLTAERDDAREQAERWEDDALRLMNERNAAQEERDELVSITKKLVIERDEARKEVCDWVEMDGATTAKEEAELRGWDCHEEKKP